MTKRERTNMGLLLCAAFRHKYNLAYLERTPMAVLMQCSRENVRLIEERALRKIRRALTPDDFELLNYLFQSDRQPAKAKNNPNKN